MYSVPAARCSVVSVKPIGGSGKRTVPSSASTVPSSTAVGSPSGSAPGSGAPGPGRVVVVQPVPSHQRSGRGVVVVSLGSGYHPAGIFASLTPGNVWVDG